MNGRNGPDFGAEQLHDLFDELSTELDKRDQTAQLFVVGGAAMALAYDDTRLTRDVDAAFEPTSTVRQLSRELGERHGLEPDWINDAVKGFLPGTDAKARTVYESDSLLVQVASPEYLLAMKLHSGRAERDIDDAVTLFTEAGYTDADQALNLLERTYGPKQLLPRHYYLAEDVAARAQEHRNRNKGGGEHAIQR